MRIDVNARTAINLDKDALIKLPRSLGDTIVCARGILWLTEDNVPHDILLRVGERYVTKGAGSLIINALEAGALRVVSRAAPDSWLAGIAHWMASVWCAPRRGMFAAP